MPIYEVEHDGKVYEVDAPSKDAALSAFSVTEKKPKVDYSRPLEAVRAGLQGMTFGSADEIGAGIAAGAVAGGADPKAIAAGGLIGSIASIFSGDGKNILPKVYGEMMADLSKTRKAYRQDHPGESLTAELAGGVATGLAGAGKVAGTKVGQAVIANTPRWLQASALGAAQGGTYGALSSDPGERLQGGATGAAIGAVAAPVAGYATDKAASTIGAITRWAKNKLSSTPKREAIAAIRQALQAEGLDADEAVSIYNKLGPQATLADVGENFRALTRASVDIPGPGKAQARTVLNARQMGQQGRLLAAAQDATGQKADDLVNTVAAIAKRRAQDAKPAYDAAFSQATDLSGDDALMALLKRPSMASALRKAQKIAADLGDEITDPENGISLKHLHYAKMALDEMNKQQKFPRHLMQLKREFLDALDSASPSYRAARQQFAGDSELIDAALAGRNFLKTAPDELAELVKGMTAGEQDLFKMGAMAGIQDLFDNTSLTHDAAAKLISKPATLKRLASVFGDSASAKKFLDAAWREAEMGRTRAVLTGGSPTAERLAGQKWLEDAIQPETMRAFFNPTDPVGMVMAAAKEILSKKPLSQETLGEISRIMLAQGMPEAEVRKILQSPRVSQALTNLNREFISRAGAASAVGPVMANQE